jgi:pre-rRNA-processing protein IPI3
MENKTEQHIEVCLGTSSNGTSLIWDIKTGDIISNFYKNKTNSNSTCVSNFHIFSTQNDKPAVNIYSMRKEQPLYQCSLSENLTCIQNSPDGNYIFAGSENGLVYVWKICTGQLIKIFSAHLKAITALCLTQDSSILVSGGSDTLIHVWSVAEF